MSSVEAVNINKTPSISAIVITKNEEQMIANCLECLQWCDEILVLDQHSEDRTVEIAKRAGARVISSETESFAELRNLGWKTAKSDWLFYVDADERVSPKLAQEIKVQTEISQASTFVLTRKNVLYGRLMTAGGWSEQLARVFRKSDFQGWFGDIHESSTANGTRQQLVLPLLHLTHRNTVDGLYKSAGWTPIEARLIDEAHQGKVTMLTIFRKTLMEFLRRLVFKGGYKDGMEGWIEAYIQGMNRGLIYIQVWERQQKPTLAEKYQRLEKQLTDEWRAELAVRKK